MKLSKMNFEVLLNKVTMYVYIYIYIYIYIYMYILTIMKMICPPGYHQDDFKKTLQEITRARC